MSGTSLVNFAMLFFARAKFSCITGFEGFVAMLKPSQDQEQAADGVEHRGPKDVIVLTLGFVLRPRTPGLGLRVPLQVRHHRKTPPDLGLLLVRR